MPEDIPNEVLKTRAERRYAITDEWPPILRAYHNHLKRPIEVEQIDEVLRRRGLATTLSFLWSFLDPWAKESLK